MRHCLVFWKMKVRPLARGVSDIVCVSFIHPIADFGHPNIHIFVHNAMEWKGIGHPIHPKCVFWDTQFWNPGYSPDENEFVMIQIMIFRRWFCPAGWNGGWRGWRWGGRGEGAVSQGRTASSERRTSEARARRDQGMITLIDIVA